MIKGNKELMGEKAPDEREIFWAFTAYILFLIPLISSYKTHSFVKFHIRQSFAFFITGLVLFGLSHFLLDAFIWKALTYLFLFIVWCFGIFYVFFGIEKPLPVIGWFAKRLPK